MTCSPILRGFWRFVRLVLAVSLLLVVYGCFTEYSLRRYLRGFSDAVVPLTATPEQKVEAILAWMRAGPARKGDLPDDFLSNRNPQDTLNYGRLLQVCGTGTNAFINLALSSGLQARRLLLLDSNRQTKHVVTEVRLDGRWVVVDTTVRAILRDASGRPLTRQELQSPATLREAVRDFPAYPPEYTYERTAHVHLSTIPVVGRRMRILFDEVYPGWEEDINWTLPLERKSFGLTMLACFMAGSCLLVNLVLSWRASKFPRLESGSTVGRLSRFGRALFSNPS